MKARTIQPQSPDATAQVFRTSEVARILGLRPARVRGIARAGFCRPRRRGRTLEFSFQDLVLLRTAQGLFRASVPPRRVHRVLGELARQLPPGRPLSGVRIYADGPRVVVRDGRTAWQPDSGQGVFSFAVDDLARAARVVLPVRAARRELSRQAKTERDAAGWFERALAQERKNDIAGACEAYRRALEIDPEMSDAYVNLGRLLHEQGDVREASRLYHLAVACAPEDPVAHYNLAIALEDQRASTAALSHYRRAVALDPNFADAHFNLARLLDRVGRRSEAMRHLLTYRRLTNA